MPCEPIIENGKQVGFVCSRGRKETPKCYKCGKKATRLCDYRNLEIGFRRDESGKTVKTFTASVHTCDKPMCAKCANTHSRDAAGDTVDFCDEHNNEESIKRHNRAEIEHERRMNRINSKR